MNSLKNKERGYIQNHTLVRSLWIGLHSRK